MKDKVVIVTGSTSGIGLGIISRFAASGAKCVLHGFADENLVEEISRDLKKAGAQDVLFDDADLSDPKAIDQMFARIADKYGQIDVLVNNAGIQYVSPIDEFPPEKLEMIIRVDLISALYTTKNAVQIMKKQQWGRIINIASAHGLVASPFKSIYVAAKHGIVGFTKSVALEVAQQGITVNAICPGYVKTPLVLNQIADTAKARHMTEEEVMKNVLLAVQATKKFVEISEVAEFAFFLASKEAGSITGAALSIDGGWTSQ